MAAKFKTTILVELEIETVDVSSTIELQEFFETGETTIEIEDVEKDVILKVISAKIADL